MNLYIFDRDFKPLGLISKYSTLIWKRRFSACGDFTLIVPYTCEILTFIKRDRYIWKSDDLECGIIEGYSLDKNFNGEQMMTIKGRFLSSLLTRRTVLRTVHYINKDVAAIASDLIMTNCIKPENPKRIVPYLNIKSGSYINILKTVQFTGKDVLSNILNLDDNLGCRTVFNIKDKQYDFELITGRNLTYENELNNSPVIFSSKFNNIFNYVYEYDAANFKNVGIVAGEGEGSKRKQIILNNDIEGLDRIEMFIDARDIQTTKTIIEHGESKDLKLSDVEYEKLLTARGSSRLLENKIIENFHGELRNNNIFKYKRDFDIGDVVSVYIKEVNKLLNVRITEIHEIYDKTFQILIKFGDEISPIKILQNKMRG